MAVLESVGWRRLGGGLRRPGKPANNTVFALKSSPEMERPCTKVRLESSFSRQTVSFRANLPSDVSRDWYRLDHALPLALMGVALVSVPVQVFSPNGLPQLRHLEAERARTTEQESMLNQEISQLRAEVERIKNEPAAVEQVARDELGMVRPNEVVFQFGR
jgi:cell division protein FtsB